MPIIIIVNVKLHHYAIEGLHIKVISIKKGDNSKPILTL